MVSHVYDKPVINLHELTNGLMKYYSDIFNQEVLGKSNDPKSRGYYQSLNEITDLLYNADHYKTSRLAHYHIKNRQDTMADQVPFYNYLNDNFFIISAQRDNLFEHALSWGIFSQSKKLNVYSHQEKFNIFQNIYRNRISIDSQLLIKYLNQYVEYLSWVDNHFTVSSYFKYDQDLARIEDYILNLNIFSSQPEKKNWKDIFDIEFNDWNRCHYLTSDLSGISGQLTDHPQLTFDNKSSNQNFQLQSIDKKNMSSSLNIADQQFLSKNGIKYIKSHRAIAELVDHKILTSPVPIKLQTMLEKKLLIKNFDECVKVYNEWVDKTNIGIPYSMEDIDATAQKEIQQWHAVPLIE
jgi:hypothetical protein